MLKSLRSTSVRLSDYVRDVGVTDRLPKDDITPVLLGLFGEVGGVLSIVKKRLREKETFTGYKQAVIEEFGDVLWYYTALCRRLDMPMDKILAEVAAGSDYTSFAAASDLPDGPVALIALPTSTLLLNETLLKLGSAAADLMIVRDNRGRALDLISQFGTCFLNALSASDTIFSEVVNVNINKVRSRFIEFNLDDLPVFDQDFPEEEQLPMEFRIEISQRKSGQSYLRWNGVFIGDPLTDNISDPDGYRFHDVFHFAHAAILHWSPVTRALIKQKRKSNRLIDEAQDGGRAIVIEEGLTAWIFSRAKGLNFFENQTSVSFDMLKTVSQFVSGYEVADCPLKLWEQAILDGYEVFRQVRRNNGGIIIGSRKKREIRYEPLGETGR